MLKEEISFEEVMFLSTAERLAYAATGCYEGSTHSVPGNIVQLFGNSPVEYFNNYLRVYAQALTNIGEGLRVQIQESI